MKPLVVFDMDDTLFNTRRHVLDYYRSAGYPVSETGGFHVEKDSGIPDSVRDAMLSDASFMRIGEPNPGYAFAMLTALSTSRPLICTHRGYHPFGREFTLDQLRRFRIEVDPHDVHVIDSKTHPDKLAYLDHVLGVKYVLVDDNPVAMESKYGRVLMLTQRWNADKVGHRVSRLADITTVALDRVWGN